MERRRFHPATWALLAGIAWVAIYFLTRIGLRQLEPDAAVAWKVLLSLLPLIPFSAFLWAFIRVVRSSDELERRIHLEALAVAFPSGVVLLMVLGLLQLAVPLPAEDWSYRHIWPFLAIFYFAGLAVARRRYR